MGLSPSDESLGAPPSFADCRSPFLVDLVEGSSPVLATPVRDYAVVSLLGLLGRTPSGMVLFSASLYSPRT